uniref:LEM domain-containing protein n=1 Tax=Anopheles farauti TaxID=69004 RepID=A0A182QTL7_9DIPT
MSRAEMYLALCLLDAIEDANIVSLQLLLDKHSANPNTIVLAKEASPMHLVIGTDDETFAEKATALMLQHGGDPNLPSVEEMLTPLHVAANVGRVAIVRMLLKAGGNVELQDEEGRTPIQHAIDGGHFDVVQVIQNHVFEQKIERKRKQLMLEHQHQQEHPVLSPSIRYKKSVAAEFHPMTASTRLHPSNALTALQVLEERKLTPNKIHYNFDATSPYYVNITHRRKDRFKTLFPERLASERENLPPVEANEANDGGFKPLPDTETETETEIEAEKTEPVSRTNLFELTERNLKNFTRDHESTGRRTSFIKCWREKIADMRERSQISRKLEDIDRILNSFSETLATKSFMDEVDETFVTAANNDPNENTIASEQLLEAGGLREIAPESELLAQKPSPDRKTVSVESELTDHTETVIVQISEEYIHTDDEAGVVFREKKMTTAPAAIPMVQVISERGVVVAHGGKHPTAIRKNPSLTSLSTVLTLPPLDYDTDALRAELTTFGEPPGPITKSTKKLYLRKLVRFRRHPERVGLANGADGKDNIPQTNYSVEMMSTVRKEEAFVKIVDYQCLEHEMSTDFQSTTSNKVARNFREGHLKKSFIYLLIDPRVSDNLPAQQHLLGPHELWRRFLSAIFYVGKGKSSRPYCHLYDAMKLYRQREFTPGTERGDGKATLPSLGGDLMVEAEEIMFQCSEESMAHGLRQHCQVGKILNRKQMAADSEKLNRIIDIWCAGKGVVCLHVFHNIMPAEAYTREAAIIDAIGLQNLTNLKRGDYYTKCLSWPMKKRKQLGILLLYKAMLIHLAEGETQLLPSDLI